MTLNCLAFSAFCFLSIFDFIFNIFCRYVSEKGFDSGEPFPDWSLSGKMNPVRGGVFELWGFFPCNTKTHLACVLGHHLSVSFFCKYNIFRLFYNKPY